MKPVNELTQADLLSHAMWEYVIDDEASVPDETYVRPLPGSRIPTNRYSTIVKADFWLADETPEIGFMLVDTVNKPVLITPGAIILNDGYAPLPHVSREQAVRERMTWALEKRAALAKLLSRQEERIFPIRYTLALGIGNQKTRASGVAGN